MSCLALFNFAFKKLQPLHHAHHLFERILATMLQTHMCGFTQDINSQRNRAPIRIPHNAARWLWHEHADSVAAQQSLRSEPSRSASASGFLVGYERERDLSVQLHAAFLERANRVQHGDDAALHVARAAAEYKMLLLHGLELLGGLGGHYVVVPVKVERALPAAETRHEAWC